MPETARVETRAGWVELDKLAVGHPRCYLRNLLRQEVAAGRVEARDGAYRLRAGALDPEVAAALAELRDAYVVRMTNNRDVRRRPRQGATGTATAGRTALSRSPGH